MSYRFADPWFLSLLVILPLILFWILSRGRCRNSSLRFPHVGSLRKAYKPMAARSGNVLFAVRLVALGLLVLAASRPQSGATREEVTAEGIDIVLALDLSSSMLAQDIEPDRIEAAKNRLNPKRAKDTSNLATILDVSMYDEQGISYRLPDHIYAERSSKG